VRAIKQIKKDKSDQSQQQIFLNEIKLLKKVDHINILKIYEFYQDVSNYYIVSNFCQGGELFDLISQKSHLTESETRIIFKQIMSAVSYLHANKILHRDLKPENFLLHSRDVKDINDIHIYVIDFGLGGFLQ
jgi:calcium-dependent protein kinase